MKAKKAKTSKPRSPMKATQAKTSKPSSVIKAKKTKQHSEEYNTSDDGLLECSICHGLFDEDISQCHMCLRPMCCNGAARDCECLCGER